jgi:hypothetical protein
VTTTNLSAFAFLPQTPIETLIENENESESESGNGNEADEPRVNDAMLTLNDDREIVFEGNEIGIDFDLVDDAVNSCSQQECDFTYNCCTGGDPLSFVRGGFVCAMKQAIARF